MLDQEIAYYQHHLLEWLGSNAGKFALVKGSELIGFYNSIGEALSEGARRFGLESFLVRRVVSSQDEIKVPALTLGILYANPS